MAGLLEDEAQAERQARQARTLRRDADGAQAIAMGREMTRQRRRFGQQRALQEGRARMHLDIAALEAIERAVPQQALVEQVDRHLHRIERQPVERQIDLRAVVGGDRRSSPPCRRSSALPEAQRAARRPACADHRAGAAAGRRSIAAAAAPASSRGRPGIARSPLRRCGRPPAPAVSIRCGCRPKTPARFPAPSRCRHRRRRYRRDRCRRPARPRGSPRPRRAAPGRARS